MTKKLVLILLLTLTLLSSCKTNEESSYLELAQNSTTLEEKIKHYQDGLNLYPDNLNYIYNTSYTLALNGQFSEAEKILNKGINTYPKAIHLYTLLSYCYKTQYKYYSYELVMESLLEQDPGFIECREELINHYLKLKRNDKALEHATFLYQMYPENKTALNALSILKGGVFKNYDSDVEIKKVKELKKPYLPPTNISLKTIYKYLKSDSFLSQFLPSH